MVGDLFGRRAPAQDTSAIQLGPSCVTTDCHADLREPSYLHGPINLNQCAPCHNPIGDEHVFEKRPDDIQSLCMTCHDLDAPKAVVHEPFAEDCTLCHDYHGAENRLLVKGGLGAEGCAQCHEDTREGLRFLHGPVAMGECLACHTAHQSDHPSLLVQSRFDLCLSCHEDFQQQIEGAISVHEPVTEQCSGCHEPHGGETQYFLTANEQDLCRGCHEDFLDQVEHFKFPHQPMTEGKACVNCHMPHSSNQEKLLAANNKELCLSCHDKPIESGGRTILNVAAQLEGAEFVHGPIRQDNCIACHQAHGSHHNNILEYAFPEDFYTAFDESAYRLCFNCHDPQLIVEERTLATDFRNGDLNLHYLHVSRDKGRTCRACHHEHASNEPAHIRSSVRFGRWMMPVIYNQTPVGGSCTTGCHLPYEYDRESAVDNSREFNR